MDQVKWYGLPKQTISLQFFKGCLPQIVLGPFLNTLTYMYFLIFQPEHKLNLCLNLYESQPIYAYKLYAYKKSVSD